MFFRGYLVLLADPKLSPIFGYHMIVMNNGTELIWKNIEFPEITLELHELRNVIPVSF